MNDIIAPMIKGYLDGFDAYQITDLTLKKEVDDYKKRLNDFAKSNQDITVFYSEFASSGLQEEYANLIAKVAMSNVQSSPNTTKESDEPIDVISVKDFLEQYKASYDEVKKCGYRYRAEEAYEKIFAIANMTDDMLEAQMILEDSRLLWKIVSEDGLDIFEPILDAMDPLNEAITITVQKQIEAYKKASSDEELTYLLEKGEFASLPMITKGIIDINLAAMIGTLLYSYNNVKLDIYKWPDDKLVRGFVGGMIAIRLAIRRTLEFMKKHFDLTFDQLLQREDLKIWLLDPKNIDGLGRIKTSNHPQNLEVFKDIIDNEILSDISIEKILLMKKEKSVWYDLTDEDFKNKAYKRADELNAHLTYHQYKELSNHVGDLESSIKKQQDIVGGKK